MGGFSLTGKNYIFTNKNLFRVRCRCRGFNIVIDDDTENLLHNLASMDLKDVWNQLSFLKDIEPNFKRHMFGDDNISKYQEFKTK